MNAAAQNFLAALPELGTAIHGQLVALHVDATLDRCDYMLRSLERAQGHVVRLRLELQRGELQTA